MVKRNLDYKPWIIFIIILFHFLLSNAQPGAIDPTFNPIDNGVFPGANGVINSVAIQSDGKIIAGGDFTLYSNESRNRIARLTINGALDPSFNPGIGTNFGVRDIKIQADGKIIIVGDFTSFNGVNRNRIARLNNDGTLDETFNPGTGANNNIYSILVQPDGKIIIVGDFTIYNGTNRSYLARLNNNGTLDQSFNIGSGANSAVKTASLQPDGKIIIAGNFSLFNGVTRNKIARINSDGTMDSSFNPGIGANNMINTTSIQPDGKIITGGIFTMYSGNSRNGITRLNIDGTVDMTFNPGSGSNNGVAIAVLQSNGKIIIGGAFTLFNGLSRNYVARLNSDGTLDMDFNFFQINSTVNTVQFQSDGKIVIGGAFSSPRKIARLTTNNLFDTSFNSTTGANGPISDLSIQSDGKIMITGLFTTFNGENRNYVARLNDDGTLDQTFNPGSGANSTVFAVVIQSDGKIIIGGAFSTFNGMSKNYIARLNSDGTLDTSFNTGIGPNAPVGSIVVQPDGKIVIGGTFTTINGISRNSVARLNSDGTLDMSFNPGSGANNMISSMVIQSDGKIIIGGHFTSFNGLNKNYLARVNNDGSLDANFNSSNGPNSGITSIIIQPDEKIIIGGSFTNFNGATASRIVRLNADGTKDSSFNSNTGPDWTVFTIALQPDGKVIVGGMFATINGINRNRIGRLHSNGELDLNFAPGTGANLDINKIKLQPDGKPIIGGAFSLYNGSGKFTIARVQNSLNQVITFNPLPSKVYGNPSFMLSSTANSGLPVSFSSSNPAFASISGNMVSIIGAGSVQITASQGGDNIWNAATNVTQTLTIYKATLTTIPANASRIYGAANPTFGITYTGFVNGETDSVIDSPPTISTTAVAISNIGTYPITPSGGSDNNYMFNYINGTLTVNKATLTATPTNASRTYGAANPTFAINYTGFVNGETASVIDSPPISSTTATVTSNTGTYPITVSGGTDNNYTFAYGAPATLTVTKAPLTATSTATKVYGATNPAFPIAYTGFLNGETASVIDTQPTATSAATALSNVGSYPITLTGGSDNNYAITNQAGTLTVTKKDLTASAISTSKYVGQPNPPFSINYTGFVNGENSSVLDVKPVATTTATTGSPIGSYPINISGGSDNNYSYSYINGVLSVLALPTCGFYISKSGNLCTDGRVLLSVKSTNGTPVSYSWSTGESANKIYAYSSDYYSVTVNFSNGCIDTETYYVEPPSGSNCIYYLKEDPDPKILNTSLFPNPVDAELTIELADDFIKTHASTVPVTLFDTMGKTAIVANIAKGEKRVSLNTQDLTPGMYLVQIGSGKTGVVRKKVMVVH